MCPCDDPSINAAQVKYSAPYDTNAPPRHVNKSPVGLVAPPIKISFMTTDNWPKIKLN